MTEPKYTVCPECRGEGSTSNFTFTASDMDEWYGDDQAAREDFVRDYRAHLYDQPCPCCRGQRVVTQDDLARWEYQQEVEAERRMYARAGC